MYCSFLTAQVRFSRHNARQYTSDVLSTPRTLARVYINKVYSAQTNSDVGTTTRAIATQTHATLCPGIAVWPSLNRTLV